MKVNNATAPQVVKRNNNVSFGTSPMALLQRNLPDYYGQLESSSKDWLSIMFKHTIDNLKKSGDLSKYQDSIVDFYQRIFGEVQVKISKVKEFISSIFHIKLPGKIDIISKQLSRVICLKCQLRQLNMVSKK